MHIKLTSVLPEGSLFFRSLTIAAGKEEIGGGGEKHVIIPKLESTLSFVIRRRDKTLKQSVRHMSAISIGNGLLFWQEAKKLS